MHTLGMEDDSECRVVVFCAVTRSLFPRPNCANRRLAKTVHCDRHVQSDERISILEWRCDYGTISFCKFFYYTYVTNLIQKLWSLSSVKMWRFGQCSVTIDQTFLWPERQKWTIEDQISDPVTWPFAKKCPEHCKACVGGALFDWPHLPI